jgi:hypothetical protein
MRESAVLSTVPIARKKLVISKHGAEPGWHGFETKIAARPVSVGSQLPLSVRSQLPRQRTGKWQPQLCQCRRLAAGCIAKSVSWLTALTGLGLPEIPLKTVPFGYISFLCKGVANTLLHIWSAERVVAVQAGESPGIRVVTVNAGGSFQSQGCDLGVGGQVACLDVFLQQGEHVFEMK